MEQFLGGLAEPWARRWCGQVAGAALAFWVAGLLIYLFRNDASAIRCPAASADPSLWCRVSHVSATGYVLAAVAAAAVVVGSASVMTVFALRLIYLLAGTGWPLLGPAAALAGPPVRWLTRRQVDRRGRIAAAGSRLPASVPAAVGRRATHRIIAEYAATAQLDRAAVARLRRYPVAPEAISMTRIGNSMAAMSERVWRRHGLDLSVCWEPLLAVLPPAASDSLASESTRVTLHGQTMGWATAALTWAWLLPAPWGVLGWIAGLLVILRVLYLALCGAIDNYCDLIEATVAVHRVLLYLALGLEPPKSTSAEPARGELLTNYLLGCQQAGLNLCWSADGSAAADSPAEGVAAHADG